MNIFFFQEWFRRRRQAEAEKKENQSSTTQIRNDEDTPNWSYWLRAVLCLIATLILLGKVIF